MLVWVNTRPQQKISSLSAGLIPGGNMKGLWVVGCHKLIQRGQWELGTVNKPELLKRE